MYNYAYYNFKMRYNFPYDLEWTNPNLPESYEGGDK